MRKFRADIKLGSGNYQRVFIDADNSERARELLEAQYGKGNVSAVFPADW